MRSKINWVSTWRRLSLFLKNHPKLLCFAEATGAELLGQQAMVARRSIPVDNMSRVKFSVTYLVPAT